MSDLIRREDVINALVEKGQSSKRYKLGEFWELNLPEITDAIDAIPSADPEQKWTPVTEALPEEDEEVLVTVRFDGTKDVKPSVYVETASQISGTWVSYGDEYKVALSKHHVIAWMPLPEPWRGE